MYSRRQQWCKKYLNPDENCNLEVRQVLIDTSVSTGRKEALSLLRFSYLESTPKIGGVSRNEWREMVDAMLRLQ